ncbi:MAG: hypothetical protein M3O46_15770, partial [Myxococcota bacterium]|nr:hypothetical protein [Myxococcota bacterium]
MEQTDIEKLIGDLEVAVDRLRSLYEQYFMGIEKIEPTVARKDADRRIYVLRKEQIRNTALRFRFQMLIQRYNTYQTHWQRICRDIENGTYKRHVIRAQRRFGTKPASVQPTPAAMRDRSVAAELAEFDREFAPAQMLEDSDVEMTDDEPTPVTRRASPGTRQSGSSRPPPPSRPPPSSRTGPPRPPPRAPPRTAPVPTPAPHRADVRRGGPPPSPRASALAGRPVSPTSARAPAVQRREGDVPDDRVRQIYVQYIETKRRQNESTAAITFDGVARSLRESSAR